MHRQYWQRLDASAANMALLGYVRPGSVPMRFTMAELQMAVADYFGLSKAELLSPSKARRTARPRQIAMYLCRRYTPSSFPEIARRFNRLDHTTAMFAVRMVEKRRHEDPQLNADLLQLEGQL